MTTQEKIIRNKAGLLELARTLGNVSQACKAVGLIVAQSFCHSILTAYFHQ